MKYEKLIIYTDGGARGNPGPAGIGCVIFDEKFIIHLILLVYIITLFSVYLFLDSVNPLISINPKHPLKPNIPFHFYLIFPLFISLLFCFNAFMF